MSIIETHSLTVDYRGSAEILPPPPFTSAAVQRLLEIFSQKHPAVGPAPTLRERWLHSQDAPTREFIKIDRIQMIQEPYSQGAQTQTFLCLKSSKKTETGYKLYLLKTPIQDYPHPLIRSDIEKTCSDHLITLKTKELEGGQILQRFANRSDLEDLVLSSIRKNARLTPNQVLTISKQLLLKVEMLHNLRIAHLDLKPMNILVHENTLRDLSIELEVFITDFGLSQRFATSKTRLGMKPTGTYCFFSPEFVSKTEEEKKEDRWVNPFQADLFSLGLSLFFLSSGIYLPYCLEPHLPRRNRQDFRALVTIYHQKLHAAFSSMDSTKLLECENLHKDLIKTYVPPIPGIRTVIFELLKILPFNRPSAGTCLKQLMEAKTS
ncbi:MAG: protein kinase family protein [Chlamydiae bacterium]|nr:protein kinase family protein [Chlamydiota bacterium]